MTLQLSTFDLTDHLDSEEAVAEYLSQVMADGDDDELLRGSGTLPRRVACPSSSSTPAASRPAS